eukprot:7343938-Lingulodinium_polyedra.AAC.1
MGLHASSGSGDTRRLCLRAVMAPVQRNRHRSLVLPKRRTVSSGMSRTLTAIPPQSWSLAPSASLQ